MLEDRPSSGDVLLRVLGYLRWDQLLNWALLSPELVVLETSEHFRDFQWDPSLEPVGRHISDLFWELVGAETGLYDVLQGREELFRLENVNRELPDGSTIYLSLKAIPFEQKPHKGLVLIVQDTTLTSILERELVHDRNQLRLARNSLSQANEELRKLNRLKSIFLSIAAHDLRSPLTALRGYTELAIQSLSQETDVEAREYLADSLSLVDSLNRLISDFLDLDVIEQGKLVIRLIACDLNAIVWEAVDTMRTVAKRKGVLMEIQLKDALPLVYADPDRIQQILFNLISNAIKYTSAGDAVIIETNCEDHGALLTVRDHGPGISESEMPWLFDLYHRTEEARQSKTKGLGLGLFIVKSLIDLQHGQISAQSEPGKGTQFRVQIPFYQRNREGIHDREENSGC